MDNGQAIFFDLDLPEVIRFKRDFVDESPRYHMIAASVFDYTWMDLVEQMGNRPVLFLAEGVFMYLNPDKVRALFIDLQHRFPGSELVCEVVNSRWLSKALQPMIRSKMQRQLGLGADATFKFGIKDGREPETWSQGIQLLDEWSYFDSNHPKLGMVRWMGHVELFRKNAVDCALPPRQRLMYENFKRIPPEQQQRILKAGLEEFARNGYEQASTNAIVQRAGIPKGTLFYFFGSKKQLFLYLIDYAVGRYVEQVNSNNEELPVDFFERLLARGRLRMQFALQEPLLYQFFFNAFLHTPQEIKAEMAARYDEYADSSRQLLYDGLDLSKFREDIDIEKAIDLTNLMLEGIFSRYANQLSQGTPEQALEFVDKLTEQVLEYFGLLKRGLYR